MAKAKRKWEALKSALPRFRGNDKSYDARVEETVSTIRRADPLRLDGEKTPDDFVEELIGRFGKMADLLALFLDGDAFARTPQPPDGPRMPPTIFAIAAAYRDARRLREGLDALSKRVGVYEEAYTRLFEVQTETDDSGQITLSDGSKYRIQGEPHVTVENQAEFNDWCRENGHENEMRLLWQTANAMVKERLEEGLPEPPGTKVWYKMSMVYTSAKGGGK